MDGALPTPIQRIRLAAVTNDTTTSIPANGYILGIAIENTTGNAITGGLKIGTTDGGTDVLVAIAVGASALAFVTDAALLKRWFSSASAQTLYIQDVVAWNSASLNITFLYVII